MIADAIEDVLVWVGRAVKLIPAFRELWLAVAADDTDAQFAAQIEMVRQIRTQQAKEEV